MQFPDVQSLLVASVVQPLSVDYLLLSVEESPLAAAHFPFSGNVFPVAVLQFFAAVAALQLAQIDPELFACGIALGIYYLLQQVVDDLVVLLSKLQQAVARDVSHVEHRDL